MGKSRAMDQRRYDYEAKMGRKCTEKEVELLKKYTPNQLIFVLTKIPDDLFEYAREVRNESIE